MITLRIIVLFTVIVTLHYDFCWCRCADAEYEIDERCCPMCAPGNHVFWPCTEDTSTTCAPCPDFTHIDEPNGLSKCFACTVCDTSRGIRVKKACTRSSDTVCEPLEQFYCTERNKDSCRFAVKHSECSPGQYIKQAGTPSTDTVCADCEVDTYSNGSFSSCLPHTQCEALGLSETTPGTKSSDSECGNTTTLLLIIVPGVLGYLFAVVIVFTIIHILKKKRSGTVVGGCINSFRIATNYSVEATRNCLHNQGRC